MGSAPEVMFLKWIFLIIAAEIIVCDDKNWSSGKSNKKWSEDNEGRDEKGEGKSWSHDEEGEGKSWNKDWKSEEGSSTWKKMQGSHTKTWSSSGGSSKKIIFNAGVSKLPFSNALQIGDILYVSGNIGNIPGTTDMMDGLEQQAKQALENIGRVLNAAGIGYSNIFRSVVYLKTMKDYSKFNEVYKKYFKKDYPARTLVESPHMALDALVGIEVTAHVQHLSVQHVEISSEDEAVFQEA